MNELFKIGDKVVYDGKKYVIEKDYGNQVFRIGNKTSFVDMVPANMLKAKKP